MEKSIKRNERRLNENKKKPFLIFFEKTIA